MTLSANATLVTPAMTGKFCVFCGMHPISKTKEHVIPQWLIELTGDLRRPINLGPLVGKRSTLGKLSFNSFVFPACLGCNQQYSTLEAAAKPVVEKLLAAQPISPHDASVLLDWFDKVRVGLWLGYLLISRNPFGIRPSFHIAWRVRKNDRCLAIYRVNETPKGLNFFGINSPAFQWMPSCFALRINHLLIFNASNLTLLAARLGLPFVKSSHYDPRTKVLHVTTASGYRKRKYPLIRARLEEPALDFYQPILASPEPMVLDGPPLIPEKMYETDFVKDSCRDVQTHEGHIFTQQGRAVSKFDQGTISIDLSRQGPINYADERYQNVLVQTFRFQEELISSIPECVHYQVLPDSMKSVYDCLVKETRGLNRFIIQTIRETFGARKS